MVSNSKDGIRHKEYGIRSFIEQDKVGLRSAEQTVQLFIQEYRLPERIVDVGGGLLTWLRPFRTAGSETQVGGDNLPKVLAADLPPWLDCRETNLLESLNISEKFDLAICLEVLEHLPRKAAVERLETIRKLTDMVLFSAAIPGEGDHNHVNENWQSYWVSLFRLHGFEAEDSIRPLVWGNPEVEWLYQQNIFVFRRSSPNSSGRGIRTCRKDFLQTMIDVVYLEIFLRYSTAQNTMEKSEAYRGDRNLRMRLLLRKIILLLPFGSKIIRVLRATFRGSKLTQSPEETCQSSF